MYISEQLQFVFLTGALRRLRAVPVLISGATGPSGPSINGNRPLYYSYN